MTVAETLDWISSDLVCKRLKLFKSHIFDDRDMRWWLEGGFSTDYKHSWDTIDTLVRLCVGTYGVQTTKEISKSDGFEATAWIAIQLVLDDESGSGSPFHGLRRAGSEEWCINVAVRLLVTVFCDLLRSPNGYFAKLLGGPRPKPIKDTKYRKRVMIVDNSPVVRDSEMKGVHAYGSIEHLGRPKVVDSSEDEDEDVPYPDIGAMENWAEAHAMYDELDDLMAESRPTGAAAVIGEMQQQKSETVDGLGEEQQWSFDALF
jgi:hypothetical protein